MKSHWGSVTEAITKFLKIKHMATICRNFLRDLGWNAHTTFLCYRDSNELWKSSVPQGKNKIKKATAKKILCRGQFLTLLSTFPNQIQAVR